MARTNETIALALLVDATAEAAREQGQSARDSRAERARAEVRAAASRRRDGDVRAIMLTGFLAVTVLAPYLIGHFLVSKTFVLKPDPGVYEPQVRGISDHFLATYLGGLVPIVFGLGAFLVARRPWQGRNVTVALGWAAVAGSLIVLLPIAQSQWHAAEQTTIAKLRETPFPFASRYYDCATWNIAAENGIHQPEMWQVDLGRLKGSTVDKCNRVIVYRGWQFVGAYDLPDGDTFTGHIVINHFDWPEPYEASGSGDVWSTNRKTGSRVMMNPVATNIDLATADGRRLNFSLDGAGAGQFDLK